MGYVFIHGLGQDSSSWDSMISYLPEHRRVQFPDLSVMLNHKEATYSKLYSSFIEYCEGIDEPLNLCGLSLGGVLALNYVIDYPERVKSIVLIATQYEMPKLLLKLQNIVFRFVPKTAFQEIGFKKKDFFQLTNSMVDLNFSKDLIDLSCVSLIICGEKDIANRKASEKLAKYIPDAELQYIANAGHEVNIQAPQELAETLEAFYKKHHL